jgi:catechol 2,3-dioxygenase-like lactoylglutathione lyase family enzyme
MSLLRMDNVLIVVDDLEAATAFFVEIGMELEGEAAVEGLWVNRVVGLDDVRQTVAMLRTPDSHGRLELAKFHNPTALSAEPKNAPVNTLGIRRIMFAVEDIEDVLARLRAHGAELVGELEQYEDSYRLCYVRGPEGIIIALAEQLSGRLPKAAVDQRLLRHLELTERHRCSLRVGDLDNPRIWKIYWTAYDGAAQLPGARGDRICVGYRKCDTPVRLRVGRNWLEPADGVGEPWWCTCRGVSVSNAWITHLEKVRVPWHAHHPRRASAEVHLAEFPAEYRLVKRHCAFGIRTIQVAPVPGPWRVDQLRAAVLARLPYPKTRTRRIFTFGHAPGARHVEWRRQHAATRLLDALCSLVGVVHPDIRVPHRARGVATSDRADRRDVPTVQSRDEVLPRRVRRHHVFELPAEQPAIELGSGVWVRLGRVDPAGHACWIAIAYAAGPLGAQGVMSHTVERMLGSGQIVS